MKGLLMPHKFRFIAIRLLVVGTCIALFSGCQQAQKKDESVSLYVDAMTLSESNAPDQAITKLQQAVEKNPDFALAYSLMGNIYLEQNKFPESAQAYQKATELNP